MAFLAPLAGAGAAGAATAGTAAALGTGAAAAGAGTALGAGLSAGTILGTGAASSGLLGGLGLNALGGMASVLPASAGLTAAAAPALAAKGLTAAAAPGIFSQAAPALGGLKSLATPGIFTKASPALGGLSSMTPTLAQAAPGFKSLAMANAPLTAPSSFGAVNQAVGLGDIGAKTASLTPELTKASYLTKGAGPSVPSIEAQQFADLASGVKTPGSLRMPSGVEGLRAPPITPETSVAQGPLAFRQALPSGIDPKANALSNFGNLIQNPSMQGVKDYAEQHPYATSAAVGLGTQALLGGKPKTPPEQDKGSIRPYEFERTQRPEAYAVSPLDDTSERMYFDSKFTALEPYSATSPKAKEIEKIAEGGIAKAYAIGGPVEMMAAQNAVGANTGYPMAGINTAMYSNPMVQRPEAVNVISPSGDAGVTAYSGEPKFARGGLSDLGDYSDGGRLLKGPGDGVSDSIPAVIGKRQPARLADGEFVIPARIVSELGNGSTEAGARKLYAMMDRIQKGRRKSVGKGKVAVDSKSDKHLPA